MARLSSVNWVLHKADFLFGEVFGRLSDIFK